MIVDLIPHDPPRRDLNASYALRGRFWLTSVGAHILWVAVAVRIPLSAPASKRPIYDQFIRPLESKVLIYRPKKVVNASPEKQVGKTLDPRGRITAPRTVIATAPNAQSQKQIIWKPVKLEEIKVDVPAPTVVARMETALPPPPQKITPKQFTAPTVAKRDPQVRSTEISATLSSAPTVAVTSNAPATTKALLPPPPKVAPKQFIPPSQRDPKLATRTEVNETLAVVASLSVGQNSVAVPQTNLPPPPKTAPKQFTPPPSSSRETRQAKQTEVTATLATISQPNGVQNSPAVPTTLSRLPGPPPKDVPIAPVPMRGNEQINLAIASVNPAPSAEMPTSSRSGQFSVAPASGEPASGAVTPGSVTVPNLTVRESAPAAKTAAKSNTVIYSEKVRPSFSSVFSVPLRPSSRSLPKSVEAQFRGRSVYAVVIPIENLPAYGTDWILWFAEVTPLPGAAPSVRAPVPFRKLELVEKGREPNDTRLQIAATLGLDGKLSNIRILSAVSDAVQALAMEDLGSWEWKPATRNSVAIAIDAVFEIPFRLAVRP